jgi:hypothetical protein
LSFRAQRKLGEQDPSSVRKQIRERETGAPSPESISSLLIPMKLLVLDDASAVIAALTQK